MYDILAKHTGKTVSAISKAVKAGDNFMTPAKALDWGLIDQIVDQRPSTEDA